MNLGKKILRNLERKLFFFAILIVILHFVFLVLAYLFPPGDRFIFSFFNLGLEANLPTYFSTLLYVVLATLAWLCFFFDRENKATRREYIPWFLLSVLFIFLSIDEFASIHEQFTDITRITFSASGLLFFAWVIPYVIILAILSIYFIPFILKLAPKTKTLVFSGAIIFVLGAVGLEMIGGSLYESGQGDGLVYSLVSAFEEIFEITGLLLAIHGLNREASLRFSS